MIDGWGDGYGSYLVLTTDWMSKSKYILSCKYL